MEIYFEDQKISATPDHLFYAEGKGWLPAGELFEGLSLQTIVPDHPAIIKSINRLNGTFDVYNLKMPDSVTYYVSGSKDATPILTSSEYEPMELLHPEQ